MNDALLIAFRDAWASQPPAEKEAWWAKPSETTVMLLSRYVTSQRLSPEEEAKLHETSRRLHAGPEKCGVDEKRLLVLTAIAYRMEQRQKEAQQVHCAEVVASWVPDADYIEAMFQHYSLGKNRLL